MLPAAVSVDTSGSDRDSNDEPGLENTLSLLNKTITIFLLAFQRVHHKHVQTQ